MLTIWLSSAGEGPAEHTDGGEARQGEAGGGNALSDGPDWPAGGEAG